MAFSLGLKNPCCKKQLIGLWLWTLAIKMVHSPEAIEGDISHKLKNKQLPKPQKYD